MANIKERFILGKVKGALDCGDTIYAGENFLAIIDGNTPKGKRLWNGLAGDVFVAKLLAQELANMPAQASAEQVISSLNFAIAKCYDGGIEDIPPEEQLAASVVIYSVLRREIWCFGDCRCMINNTLFSHVKKVDILMSELRSFYVHAELESGKTLSDIEAYDTGREAILPFLKRQSVFANKAHDFGYDVLNGGEIVLEHVKKYRVSIGDFVVLASDGYPVLCDTLEKSEKKLLELLEKDPLCINENKSTKGYNPALNSYDDRSYLSFTVI